MPTGQITRIEKSRGLGFIQQTGGAGDILFYLEAVPLGLRGRLAEGQRVEFDRSAADYGDQAKNGATNVRLVRTPLGALGALTL